MGQFVGLDVSVNETSVCVVDDTGAVLHESKVRSTPRAIVGAIRRHAPEAGRVGLEAGGASSWLCRELIEAGLPVIHMEARHAHRALSMRLNKTDRNDARGLADLMRVGWFKPAHSKTAPSHRLRSTLLARKRLVDIRRHMENQLRNIIKTSGAVLGSTAGRGLLKKVETACEDDSSLALICEPLMEVIKTTRAQTAVYDRLLRGMARRDATARRMMTVPGVGVMTARRRAQDGGDPALHLDRWHRVRVG